MSVDDGAVLGISTGIGGGTGVVLANTGTPAVVAALAAVAIIVAVGLLTRMAHRKQED